MTATRRTAILAFLLALAVVITLAITTGANAHASTTTATRTATLTGVSLHDTRSAPTSVRHHLKWYVLKWAETKVGGPYVWGGNGPRGYDCSGLVVAAEARYGKTLPRTTSGILSSGRVYRISRSKLMPGDLVFWGDFHVEFATERGTFGAHSSGTLIGWARFWGAPTFWRVR